MAGEMLLPHLQGSSQVLPAGRRPVVVLLHGLFGKPDDWNACADQLSARWPVLQPELPIFDLPRSQSDVNGLTEHVERELNLQQRGPVVLGGNSLGGHIALKVALSNPARVKGLIILGSSGLFERGLEPYVPRRPSREWLRGRLREVFCDERHATEMRLEEIARVVADGRRLKALFHMAASAKRDNLRDALQDIRCPVLLAWGRDDRITPPCVAREFQQRLPHAELQFISQCGHAPLLEQPLALARAIAHYLTRHFACESRSASQERQ